MIFGKISLKQLPIIFLTHDLTNYQKFPLTLNSTIMIIDDDFSLDDEDDDLPGYPLYPASEDVFNKGLIEEDIDPEDISKIKQELGIDAGDWNEKDFDDDLTGDDLDVPGSELDDDEIDGNEDEENNYYSLGGDNHNDLEENQGD